MAISYRDITENLEVEKPKTSHPQPKMTIFSGVLATPVKEQETVETPLFWLPRLWKMRPYGVPPYPLRSSRMIGIWWLLLLQWADWTYNQVVIMWEDPWVVEMYFGIHKCWLCSLHPVKWSATEVPPWQSLMNRGCHWSRVGSQPITAIGKTNNHSLLQSKRTFPVIAIGQITSYSLHEHSHFCQWVDKYVNDHRLERRSVMP